MTYDPIDTNDDGVVDADVDNQSVRTDELISNSEPDINVYNDGGTYTAVGPYSFLPLTNNGDVLELIDTVDDNLTSGAHIHVASGQFDTDNTYSDGVELGISTDDVMLTGDGSSTHIRLKNNATVTDEGAKLIEPRGDRIVLAHFRLDGNQQNNGGEGDGDTITNADDGHNITIYGNDCRLHDVYSVNSTGDGVEFWIGSERPLVTNCHFLDNWEHNVHTHGSQDVEVTGCVLHNEYNNGHVDTYCGPGEVNDGFHFHGNTIIGGQEEGIKVQSGGGTTKNVVIENNVIRGTAKQQIKVYHNNVEDNPPTDITVKNNICRDGSLQGITVTGGKTVRVYNNEIYRSVQDSLVVNGNGPLSDVVVEDNHIVNTGWGNSGSPRNAIFVDAKDEAVSDVDVRDNRVVAPDSNSYIKYGANLNVSGTGSFTDAHLADNIFRDFSESEGVNGAGNFTQVKQNEGYATENEVRGSVADGGTIAHGLDENPNRVMVSCASPGVIANYTGVDATNVTISLVDDAGSSVGTSETIDVWVKNR